MEAVGVHRKRADRMGENEVRLRFSHASRTAMARRGFSGTPRRPLAYLFVENAHVLHSMRPGTASRRQILLALWQPDGNGQNGRCVQTPFAGQTQQEDRWSVRRLRPLF